MPGPWNAVAGGGDGYGTYRLTVLCGQAHDLALLLPTVHSAMRLFVNGREVAHQGFPGTSAASTRPAVTRQLVSLPGASCPLTLVLHVANFHHRQGGLMQSPRLGGYERLLLLRERGMSLDEVMIGGFLVMSLLTLSFYAARRSDPTPLWLGLFCLSMMAYFELGKEHVFERLVVHEAAWEPYLKVQTLAFYVATPLLVLFMRALYPVVAERRLLRVVVGGSLASAAAVLVLPARLHTWTLPFMQVLTVVAAAWIVVMLATVAWRQKNVWALMLVGMALFYPVMVLDLLPTNTLRFALSPLGLLAYGVAPAAVLARRFAHALTAEEMRAVEERERVDLLGRAARAGVLDWDAVGGHVTYSDHFREMLGYPVDTDTSGWDFFSLVHPDDLEVVRGGFREQMRDRSRRSALRQHEPRDYRLRCRDGSYIWIHAEAISITDGHGRVLRYVCSFIDVTLRRNAEQAVRNQAKFTSDLLDSVPVAMAMRDVEGRYLFVNRTWEKYFRGSRQEVVGTRVQDRIPAAEAERVLALDREVLEGGPGAYVVAEDFEHRGRRYTQTRTVMADQEGAVLGVVIASHDTTDRHAMEQALGVERDRLALLVHSTKAGFSDWNSTTDVIVYSDRFKEMLGYPADTDTSAWPSTFDMMHPEDREPMREKFRAMIRRKAVPGLLQEPGEPMEYRLRRADGGYFWVHAEGIAQVDETGRTRRFITSFIDITKFHDQEEALRQSVRLREEVERMSRHDLKTPINSVIAVSRLLRENSQLSPDDTELLGTVERAGYRILNMVNLSLDLFRMEQGTYRFSPQAIDLVDVARKAAADLESQASSKNIGVRVRQLGGPTASPTSLLARAEELLCYSMLANLLKNAIEAAPEGSMVTITLESAGPSVRLHMHNEGAVPPALREKFFAKYSTSGKSAGLGLGTYSAQLMARVQEGDISLRTSEEEGTTITVRLGAALAGDAVPTAAAAQAGLDRERLPELPAMRVLVVDDDEFNRLVLRRHLPTPPLTVEMAVNGRAALDAAARDWPDAVLLDLEMPVMDGYQAAARLRVLERERREAPGGGAGKRCKIVAISSNDDPATMERARAAGCDDYLVKPAPRETLWRILAGGVREGSTPAGRTEAAPSDVVRVDADLRESLPGFLASRRQALDEMPQALAEGDRVRFKRLAHRLAGSLAMYGFTWAAGVCREMERRAPDGDPADLLARATAVRAHLDNASVEFRPAKNAVSMESP